MPTLLTYCYSCTFDAIPLSANLERARTVARQIRAGNVHVNGASGGGNTPFGGYKQSGNGREFGVWGLEEFLETKAILGYNAVA